MLPLLFCNLSKVLKMIIALSRSLARSWNNELHKCTGSSNRKAEPSRPTTIEPPSADDHRWPSTIATIKPHPRPHPNSHPSIGSPAQSSTTTSGSPISPFYHLALPIAAINDRNSPVSGSLQYVLMDASDPGRPPPPTGDATCTLVAAGLRSIAFRLISFDTLTSGI